MEQTPAVAPEPAPTNVETAPATEAPAPTADPKPEPEKTIGEILETGEPAAPKLVPEAALINEKKGRKDAERKVKDLQAQIAAGATHEEVADDIDTILEEFGLDETNKKFFNRMAKTLEARAERKAEEKLAAAQGPQAAADRQKKIDDAFKVAFKDAIERNPEYDGIAVPSVIKALSLLPENADKTFSQILEDTYGGSIQGRRTIETAAAGGSKAPQPIDFDKASADQQYFAQIMADPATKAEYNKGLAKRLKL